MTLLVSMVSGPHRRDRCSRSRVGSQARSHRPNFSAAKRLGFSDIRLATLFNTSEQTVRDWRYAANVVPVYKRVDTCAAEFEAHTPYLY